MEGQRSMTSWLSSLGIAALCFGYFASYVPYTMLTKLVTNCKIGGMTTACTGFEIQPIAVFASLVGMFSFITFAGWWKHCTHSRIGGFSFPRPQWFTFISGLCTASQIITTTLAYTFKGVSIVLAMLIMRGGVLIMAPVVDLVVRRRKRHIAWPSWVAAGLTVVALIVGMKGKIFSGESLMGEADTFTYVLFFGDMALYLFGYFFRLFFMSGRAKSDDGGERRRYFAEEQMVANVALLGTLFVIGLVAGRGADVQSIPAQLWNGFTTIPFSGYFWYIFALGFFSYGTGLFGSLIYLDKRENTFTVPANRISSVLAGVLATFLLHRYFGEKPLATDELMGAGIIIFVILFLMYRSVMDRRRSITLYSPVTADAAPSAPRSA